MDDWLLSASICQILMVCPPNYVQHDRAGAEIERHTIPDMKIMVTCQGMRQPSLLDLRHPDGRPGQGITDYMGITVEPTSLQDGGQPVHMDDMVYFGMRRYSHVSKKRRCRPICTILFIQAIRHLRARGNR